MEKYCKKYCKKHCVIDFKNKIVRTYDEEFCFTYNSIDCTYLVDATINHVPDEGIFITGTEVHQRYTDTPINLSEIDGEVSKRSIKKSSIFKKLEKWLGYDEYEYVSGTYYVKYNNQVTQFIIPKDTFIFKHTTTNKK